MTTYLTIPLTPEELEERIAAAVQRAIGLLPATAPPPPPTDDLSTMSRRDVMQALRVSSPTLYALEESGDLVPMRVRRSVRYRRTDVERYLSGDDRRAGR